MTTHSKALLGIASLTLEVVPRPLDALTPHPNNPRVHKPSQIGKLAANIKAWGFLVPVLIDAGNQILAGHARVLAARKAGLHEVPTIRLEHLDPAQAQALMIADNRLGELSSWDDQKLGELLLDLSLHVDVALELTGFDVGEIDIRIEGLETAIKTERTEKADQADLLPPASAGPPVSRVGDLWVLGRHRVLCGSSLDPDAFARLFDGAKAQACITDPPYNVPIGGYVGGLGRIQHREFPMGCGEMSVAEFTSFLGEVLALCAAHSSDGALHFVFMDWKHMGELLAAANRVYSQHKALCVWAKDNAGMGSLYRSQHELVGVFKHGTGPHRNNVELGRHGRNRTNVWRYPGANSFGRKGEEGTLLALHPTVKPVQMIADAILDCTARAEIVSDAFLGSGTTVMAAERVGRRCFGLELDPLYVDVIIRRWQAWTGDLARHAETGRSFQETATERATTPETAGVPVSLEGDVP